ncbi:hypothetical protein Scep_021302 [Stephania cephalantha]|uniref:non-specific serine/threonine protein kinase n=1 Tax=Stephania cephalantha TaxID=152367 RepID=A0AAP0HWR3_9MAGN
MADFAQSPSSSNGSSSEQDPSESGGEEVSSQTPPPPESEGNSSPPSPDNSPAPPDQSSSSPPPPPQDSNSSPPNSNPSPPPKSGSSPPTSSSNPTPPPSNSGSPKSPPPPQSKSAPPPPPPPPSGGSSPVPPVGNNPPPPSPSKDSSSSSSSPSNTPSTSYPPPPPPASGGAAFSPPVQISPPPPSGNSIVILPPLVPGSPPAPISTPVTPFDGTPSAPSDPSGLSTNPHSDHFTKDTPSTGSGLSSKSTSGSSTGNVAGVALAGVAILSLVAVVFLFLRKRKRKSKAYYIAPPNSFSVQTDGYYYGQQQHSARVPGNSHEYYSGKQSGPGNGNSYGSAGRSYSSGGPDSGVFSTKSSFSYEELMEITNGFSRENILGEGGFGCVYKGRLPDGRVVAVKQLKAGSGQGDREFRAEVEIISRVHHRHLVSLVGYCIAEYQRLLVYEFVPNNTLEYHLHDKGATVLPWLERMKIAIGAARGLAYLHEDCHPRIIHRDIKSANILLDDEFEAQAWSQTLDRHIFYGLQCDVYMAPEYASSGKLTDRSDVFSFGVMLLELVTGRKPVDASRPLGDESLVEWARPLLLKALETGEVSELVDPRLEKKYVESEMLRMIETAAACVRHSAPKRPRMIQVARALDTDGDMPDLTNGVKVGQSVVVGTPNTEIHRLQRLAFGSDDASDYDLYSGEFRDVPLRPPPSTRPGESSVDITSGEFESRPMNPRVGSRRL